MRSILNYWVFEIFSFYLLILISIPAVLALPLYYYILYCIKIDLGPTIFIGSIYSSILGLIYLGVAVFGLSKRRRSDSIILLGICLFLTALHSIANSVPILGYKLGHHIFVCLGLSGIFLLRLYLMQAGKIRSA
jgi:hypothetical protein